MTTPRKFRLDRRASGMLLHVTSLPGPHGSGDAGPEARRFIDWLAAAGQTWWQVLPTGPIDPAGCPYIGFSAFAFNPLLISLELLRRDGLLTRAQAAPMKTKRADRVDFPAVSRFREQRLRQACERFFAQRKGRAAFEKFCAAQARWLDTDALFFAIRESCGCKPWWRWPAALRRRDPAALREAGETLAEDVRYFRFTQFIAAQQWGDLRRYATRRGVGIIGDLPIFIAHDSSDVWANPGLFDLRADGTCRVVSGAAPDDFSRSGQLWGHPLYRWAVHRRDGYTWWTRRFARLFELFDAVRIDHFLGFNRYWEVPGRAKTARHGRWKRGPGAHFFDTVLPKLGPCNIIAEDLGLLVPGAVKLRDRFNFPGMRVVQFAFGSDDGYHAPHNCPQTSVVYTGTHDNDTVAGWYRGASPADRRRALAYTGGTAKTIAADLVRVVATSPANLAVYPAQDLLGLGRAARMNVPGTIQGNWRWRLTPGALDRPLAAKLRELTALVGRTP